MITSSQSGPEVHLYFCDIQICGFGYAVERKPIEKAKDKCQPTQNDGGDQTSIGSIIGQEEKPNDGNCSMKLVLLNVQKITRRHSSFTNWPPSYLQVAVEYGVFILFGVLPAGGALLLAVSGCAAA